MTIDLKAAVQFINENGNDFQKSYLKTLFGIGSLEQTLKYMSAYQNVDGGWTGIDADYVGECSSMVCTIIALWKFECLDVNTGEMFDATISYLKKEQKPSGGWGEPLGILDAHPPPWYYPKILINVIWITNALLRYLLSRKPEEVEMISKAKAFVRKFWEGDCFPGGYKINNWMGIVSFHDADNAEDKDIYHGCMKNLRSEIKELDMGDICWVLNSFMYLGTSQEDSIIQEGLRQIEDKQASDGGFPTIYGDHQRVDTAINALESLAHYNQAVRQQLLTLIKEVK